MHDTTLMLNRQPPDGRTNMLHVPAHVCTIACLWTYWTLILFVRYRAAANRLSFFTSTLCFASNLPITFPLRQTHTNCTALFVSMLASKRICCVAISQKSLESQVCSFGRSDSVFVHSQSHSAPLLPHSLLQPSQLVCCWQEG